MGNLSHSESTLFELNENEEYQLFHIKKSDFIGYVDYNSTFFDNKETLKNLKNYKLSKLKLWYDSMKPIRSKEEAEDINYLNDLKITGIETIYKDKRDNYFKSVTHSMNIPSRSYFNKNKSLREERELINSSKSQNRLKGNFYVDFKLKQNEFIIKVIAQHDKEGISYIELTTNKLNTLKLGIMRKFSKTTTIYNLKGKVVAGFYGGFLNNSLIYFGIYTCSIRNIREIFPYFLLRKRIKKENIPIKFTNIKTNKTYHKLEEPNLTKKMPDAYIAFLGACNLPDYLFANVIKYL